MDFIKNNKISIFLTACTLFFIYTQLENGDGCRSGMATAFWTLFFLCVYACILISYLFKAILHYKRHRQKINFNPVYITILFCSIFFIKVNLNIHPFSSKIIYQASMDVKKRITLYQNKKFRIEIREACFMCYIQGKYVWKSDTLILDRNDISIKEYHFSNKYLLSKDSNYLLPIDTVIIDSAFWFKRNRTFSED